MKKTKVVIIESERGWGSRVDEVKYFDTRKKAEDFVRKYNQRNVDDWNKTQIVPEWYMQAEIVED